MKIYTKRGDDGQTGLLYGGRVSKTDSRVAAYGSVDEAVSALGVARATCRDRFVTQRILEVQKDLFTVGSELATDRDQYVLLQKHFSVVTPEMTARLEANIDAVSEEISLPRSFIIPGASHGSGALDVARSVLRRAEREVVGLNEAGLLKNQEVLRYLNRLSDFLFMLARYEDRAMPFEALTGEPAAPGGKEA